MFVSRTFELEIGIFVYKRSAELLSSFYKTLFKTRSRLVVEVFFENFQKAESFHETLIGRSSMSETRWSFWNSVEIFFSHAQAYELTTSMTCSYTLKMFKVVEGHLLSWLISKLILTTKALLFAWFFETSFLVSKTFYQTVVW